MSLSRGVFLVSVLAVSLAEVRFVEAQEAAYRPSGEGALAQLEGEGGCVANKGEEGCATGRALDNAFRVAVSPDDRSIYVTSPGPTARAVAVFARDRGTGVLTQLEGEQGCIDDGGYEGCAIGRALQGTHDVTVSPDGTNVYVTTTFVASSGSGGVAVFARDLRTGALTQLEGEAGCVDNNGEDGCARGRTVEAARGVALSPERNVYVTSLATPREVAVFARDGRTGALTQLHGRDGCVASRRAEGCGQRPRAYGAARRRREPGREQRLRRGVGRGGGVRPSHGRTGVLTQLRGKDGCVHSGDADGCARARALGEGVSVAVSPDGSNVYVAAEAVAVFARDRKSGALSQLRGKNGLREQ